MSVRNQYQELSEEGFNADATVGVAWKANFNARCVRIIRDDSSVGEGKETLQEFGHSNGRHVDAVLGNRLERRVRRRFGVPIKLSVDSAWLLNDRVATKWIGKRFHQDISPR